MKNNKILFFAYLGLFATIMVGTGEFLVHFSSSGFDSSIPYSYFLGVPESRLTIGQYLIAPFVAFYIFGYWHLYQALRPGSENLARAVLVLGLFAFVIGGIWVGSRAHLGATVQALQEANVPELQEKIIASYDLHMENLVQILRVIVLLISICFVWAILIRWHNVSQMDGFFQSNITVNNCLCTFLFCTTNWSIFSSNCNECSTFWSIYGFNHCFKTET